MVSNIIEFAAKAASTSEESAEDPATAFVRDHLLPWALEAGIDIQSTKFKLNGATIMTCIQGMLLDDI